MSIDGDGGTAFALDLFGKMPREGNLVFSPFSIYVALMMTVAGARGATAQQMAATLRLPADPAKAHTSLGSTLRLLSVVEDGAPILRVSNSLWLLDGLAFNSAFLEHQRRHYAAEPQVADFTQPEAACRAINAWVHERTEGRIRDLVIPRLHVTEETLLVLVNALYLIDRWSRQFSAADTRDEDFFIAPGASVRVPMMRMEDEYNTFAFFDAGEFKLLELPYRSYLSMVIALPERIDGAAGLDAGAVMSAFAAMKPARVRMVLPKFRIETALGLKEILCALGMELAFGSAADFSAITNEVPVQIGEVVHKGFIAVDEEGTEAAAATAVVMMAGAMFREYDSEWVSFRADHSFLFFIRDNRSRAVLFMGRVSNPAGP